MGDVNELALAGTVDELPLRANVDELPLASSIREGVIEDGLIEEWLAIESIALALRPDTPSSSPTEKKDETQGGKTKEKCNTVDLTHVQR